jgi:hypothetical protein
MIKYIIIYIRATPRLDPPKATIYTCTCNIYIIIHYYNLLYIYTIIYIYTLLYIYVHVIINVSQKVNDNMREY